MTACPVGTANFGTGVQPAGVTIFFPTAMAVRRTNYRSPHVGVHSVDRHLAIRFPAHIAGCGYFLAGRGSNGAESWK